MCTLQLMMRLDEKGFKACGMKMHRWSIRHYCFNLYLTIRVRYARYAVL